MIPLGNLIEGHSRLLQVFLWPNLIKMNQNSDLLLFDIWILQESKYIIKYYNLNIFGKKKCLSDQFK